MDPTKDLKLGTDGQGGTDLSQEDDSLVPEIPDTIATFEDLERHLAGGEAGKKPGEKDEPKTVSMEEFQAMQSKLEEFTAERQGLMDLLGRLANREPAQPQKAQDLNFFPESEDPSTDVPTTGQINRALASMMQAIQQGFQNLSTVASKSDYSDVVNTHLPALLRERPELSQAINKGNVQALQYHLADLYRQLKSGKGKQGGDEEGGDADLDNLPDNVKKILGNLGKPGNARNAATAVPASKGKWVDNLNDEDFGKLVNAVINDSIPIGKFAKGG